MLKRGRNLYATTLVRVFARFYYPDVVRLAFFVFPTYCGLDLVEFAFEGLVLRVFFVLGIAYVVGFRNNGERRNLKNCLVVLDYIPEKCFLIIQMKVIFESIVYFKLPHRQILLITLLLLFNPLSFLNFLFKSVKMISFLPLRPDKSRFHNFLIRHNLEVLVTKVFWLSINPLETLFQD